MINLKVALAALSSAGAIAACAPAAAPAATLVNLKAYCQLNAMAPAKVGITASTVNYQTTLFTLECAGELNGLTDIYDVRVGSIGMFNNTACDTGTLVSPQSGAIGITSATGLTSTGQDTIPLGYLITVKAGQGILDWTAPGIHTQIDPATGYQLGGPVTVLPDTFDFGIPLPPYCMNGFQIEGDVTYDNT